MSMYKASAPVFTRLLETLSSLLDKAEAYAAAKAFDVDVLLNARLAPDMFPLSGQIKIAAAFVKNAACRLAGETPPDYNMDDYKTLADLRALVARTADIVHSLPEAAFASAAERDVTFRAGQDLNLTLKGGDYLNRYALPQIYFHVTMAYAILRHNGVEIGKKDYMAALLKDFTS